MRGKTNKRSGKINKSRSYSRYISMQKLHVDAMQQYLKKYDWLKGNVDLNIFEVVKFKEHFPKTENLDFKEAVDAVRIYEKINFNLEHNQQNS